MLGGGKEFNEEFVASRNGEAAGTNYTFNANGDIDYGLGPEAAIVQLRTEKMYNGGGDKNDKKNNTSTSTSTSTSISTSTLTSAATRRLVRPPPVAFEVVMAKSNSSTEAKPKKKSGFFGGAATARSKEANFLKARETEWKKQRLAREKKILEVKSEKRKKMTERRR